MCKKRDCFANRGGRCLALSDTKFKKECPFYRIDLNFDKQMREVWKYSGKRGDNSKNGYGV